MEKKPSLRIRTGGGKLLTDVGDNLALFGNFKAMPMAMLLYKKIRIRVIVHGVHSNYT